VHLGVDAKFTWPHLHVHCLTMGVRIRHRRLFVWCCRSSCLPLRACNRRRARARLARRRRCHAGEATMGLLRRGSAWLGDEAKFPLGIRPLEPKYLRSDATRSPEERVGSARFGSNKARAQRIWRPAQGWGALEAFWRNPSPPVPFNSGRCARSPENRLGAKTPPRLTTEWGGAYVFWSSLLPL